MATFTWSLTLMALSPPCRPLTASIAGLATRLDSRHISRELPALLPLSYFQARVCWTPVVEVLHRSMIFKVICSMSTSLVQHIGSIKTFQQRRLINGLSY